MLNMQKLQSPIFWMGILGAIKLLADTLGFKFIGDSEINSIANGVAAICTVAGVFTDYGKTKKTSELGDG